MDAHPDRRTELIIQDAEKWIERTEIAPGVARHPMGTVRVLISRIMTDAEIQQAMDAILESTVPGPDTSYEFKQGFFAAREIIRMQIAAARAKGKK